MMSWFRSTVPVLLLFAVQLPAQTPTTATAAKPPSYPVEVSLMQESGGVVFRLSSNNKRLYTYDPDPAGRSVCNEGCASSWPPVLAPNDVVPMGDWTIVIRADGARQWALKGKPVYTYFHDAAGAPGGDGMGGVWHLVPYMPAPANPAAGAR